MSSNQKYQQGYAAGYHGTEPSWEMEADDHFMMGFADGKGDKDSGVESQGVKSAFISEDFYETNEPPEGYNWRFIFDTPEKGDVYLTKAGNAGVAKSHPKNGRKRQLLDPIQSCGASSWLGRGTGNPPRCKFCVGHPGKHSWQLLSKD